MTTQPTTKTHYNIKAQFIGPIMNLDCQLSTRDQNLIFATNGVGKSFIARAFRMLDNNAFDNADQDTIAESIVSEEASLKTGIGSFVFSKGSKANGRLSLNTKTKITNRFDIGFIYLYFQPTTLSQNLKVNNMNLMEILNMK